MRYAFRYRYRPLAYYFSTQSLELAITLTDNALINCASFANHIGS